MDGDRRSSADPVVRNLAERVETLERRTQRAERAVAVLYAENKHLREWIAEDSELAADVAPDDLTPDGVNQAVVEKLAAAVLGGDAVEGDTEPADLTKSAHTSDDEGATAEDGNTGTDGADEDSDQPDVGDTDYTL